MIQVFDKDGTTLIHEGYNSFFISRRIIKKAIRNMSVESIMAISLKNDIAPINFIDALDDICSVISYVEVDKNEN